MKIRNFKKILSLVVVISFIMITLATAQEAAKKSDKEVFPDPSKEYPTSEQPEDTYLAKFKAIDVSEKLVKRNLEQIYLLKVIVTNFDKDGKNNWKAEYDKVYEGYKKAMELYYKRNIIYARVEFENNRKAIANLMKKISLDYKKNTQTMLNKCANKILALHLDAKVKSDPNKHRELFLNQLRLKIAYGQYDDGGSSFIDNNFETSIYHYRVSKTYAIQILQDLIEADASDTPETIEKKVDKVRDEYKFDKADNLNRIYEDKKVKGSAGPG